VDDGRDRAPHAGGKRDCCVARGTRRAGPFGPRLSVHLLDLQPAGPSHRARPLPQLGWATRSTTPSLSRSGLGCRPSCSTPEVADAQRTVDGDLRLDRGVLRPDPEAQRRRPRHRHGPGAELRCESARLQPRLLVEAYGACRVGELAASALQEEVREWAVDGGAWNLRAEAFLWVRRPARSPSCPSKSLTAHAVGIQAILSPSAAGVDDVLAVFVQHIALGTVEPTLTEEWHTLADVKTR
jgi:hypothetical protein